MAEILTSDLVYGNDAEFGANGAMTKAPSMAKRGEALPKGYEGPPSADELREMGVLVDREEFMRRGGFEPEGGRQLPESLGNSWSGNAVKAAQARALGEQADENQAELNEKSRAGEPLDLGEGEKANKKEAAAIRETQRPEVKRDTPAETPSESDLDKRAEADKNA